MKSIHLQTFNIDILLTVFEMGLTAAQVSPELLGSSNFPASASQILRLQSHDTVPRYSLNFLRSVTCMVMPSVSLQVCFVP